MVNTIMTTAARRASAGLSVEIRTSSGGVMRPKSRPIRQALRPMTQKLSAMKPGAEGHDREKAVPVAVAGARGAVTP